MEVKSLIMRQMPRYSDMYMRPYESDLKDDRLIDALERATAGGHFIEANSISDISGKIIIPSSRVDGIGRIDNGWDEQRCMFMMELVVNKTSTSRVHMVVSGYTDHSDFADVSNRNKKLRLPDNLRFYFNSTYKIRTLRTIRGNDQETRVNTSSASQILTRTDRANLSNGRRGTLTMRPEDIIANQSTSESFKELLDDEDFIDVSGEETEWRDTRPEFREAIKLSRRSNSNSADYLASTLSALRDAEDEFADSDKSVALRARGKVREEIVENDDFWDELATDTQVMSSGYVEWGELLEWNRDLDDIADISFGAKTKGVDNRGYSKWDDSSNEGLAATIIKDTIIGYMIENLYIKSSFSVTNDTRGGHVSFTVGKFIPFQEDMDVKDNLNEFMSRVKTELFKNLLFHRDMVLSISVEAHIHRDIVIDISIDGDEEEHFVFPAFADALVSPILTSRIDHVDEISGDIRKINRTLTERRHKHRDSELRDRILTGGRSDDNRRRGGNDEVRIELTGDLKNIRR